MKRKYCYILLTLLVIISACKKDSSPQSFTESSYPLAVGDWWQYQLTSLTGSDTFMLSVVSMTNVYPYVQYKCNIILYGAVVDSGYFIESDTSMAFMNIGYPYYFSFPNFHLNFPAQTGDKWFGAFPGDTIDVVNVSPSYQIDYGHTYGPCYFLSEYYDLPHNNKEESWILTPKIGLVSQSITFNSDTAGKTASYGGGIQIQQSINLINYHVQ